MIRAALLLLCFLGACSGGGGNGDGSAPAGEVESAPDFKVVDTFPAQSATGVDGRPTIRITFSSPVDRFSLKSGFIRLTGPDGEIAGGQNTAGQVLTITPQSRLAAGTRFTLTVARGVSGTSGASLGQDYSLEFTTLDFAWQPAEVIPGSGLSLPRKENVQTDYGNDSIVIWTASADSGQPPHQLWSAQRAVNAVWGEAKLAHTFSAPPGKVLFGWDRLTGRRVTWVESTPTGDAVVSLGMSSTGQWAEAAVPLATGLPRKALIGPPPGGTQNEWVVWSESTPDDPQCLESVWARTLDNAFPPQARIARLLCGPRGAFAGASFAGDAFGRGVLLWGDFGKCVDSVVFSSAPTPAVRVRVARFTADMQLDSVTVLLDEAAQWFTTPDIPFLTSRACITSAQLAVDHRANLVHVVGTALREDDVVRFDANRNIATRERVQTRRASAIFYSAGSNVWTHVNVPEITDVLASSNSRALVLGLKGPDLYAQSFAKGTWIAPAARVAGSVPAGQALVHARLDPFGNALAVRTVAPGFGSGNARAYRLSHSGGWQSDEIPGESGVVQALVMRDQGTATAIFSRSDAVTAYRFDTPAPTPLGGL